MADKPQKPQFFVTGPAGEGAPTASALAKLVQKITGQRPTKEAIARARAAFAEAEAKRQDKG